MVTENINIDVRPGGIPIVIHVTQYEVGLRQFIFTPYTSNGTQTVVAGSATLEGTKPDGYAFQQACEMVDGVITYTLQEQLCAVEGRVWSRLVIRDTDGGMIGYTAIVWVVGRAGVADDAVMSDSDISALRQFLDEFGTIDAYRGALNGALAAVGGPLVAATASAMTDTTKVYVYTGSESGYTEGHWYYWNGSAWTDGGVYQSTGINTDKTLTVEDMAADAKVTGDAVTELKNDLGAILDVKKIVLNPTFIKGKGIDISGMLVNSSARIATEEFIDISYADDLFYEVAEGYRLSVAFYSGPSESNFVSVRYWKTGSGALKSEGKYIRLTYAALNDSPALDVIDAENITVSLSYKLLVRLDDVSNNIDDLKSEWDDTFIIPENYDRLTDKTSVADSNFAQNSGSIVSGTYLVFTMYIPVEPDTTYVGSGFNYYGGIRNYNDNRAWIANEFTTSGKQITTGPNTHYLRISVNNNAVASSVVFQKGTTATPINGTELSESISVSNKSLFSYWKDKTIVYPHSSADIIDTEFADGGVYVWWTGSILVRGKYSNGWTIAQATEVVGSDYSGVAPSGNTAVKIPYYNAFVLDYKDSSQRLKVVSYQDYNPDTQLILLQNSGYYVLSGALLSWITKQNLAEIENELPYIADVSTDFISENRDLQNDSTLLFTWASDIHHQVRPNVTTGRYGVTLKKLAEMAQVAEAIKTDFLVITGDIVNGYYPVAEQKMNLIEVVNTLRGNCEMPVVMVEGNHDDNSWYASANGSGGTEYTGLSEVLNNQQFTSYAMNNSIDYIHFDKANPLGGYYYIDYPKSKVRTIVLNAEDIPYIENADNSLKYYGQWTMGFQQEQLEWLASDALQFDTSDWGVVFFLHNDSNMSGNTQTTKNLANLNAIINAFAAKTSGNTVSTETDFEVDVSYDFVNNKSNNVIAWFSGHTHTDGSEIINGVPHIRILNAFNATGGGYDIVTIDRKNRKIYTKRYNNEPLPAYDREITY